MERLTYRDEEGEAHLHYYQMDADAHENCNTVYEVDKRRRYVAFRKLADYEDAEEQGLLLRLPCKVGTEVYNITWWDDVQEKVVVKGKTYYRTVRKHKVTKSTFRYFDIDEFGKTIFLTREEAEAKLKELRHNND